MSQAEYLIWKAYRLKRGSLFFGRRLEQAIGGFSALYMSGKGVKSVDAYSFMPHEQKPQAQEMSLEEYMMQKFGDGEAP